MTNTNEKQPELNVTDKVVLKIDAQSHSFNYARVEATVVERQSISLEIEGDKLVGISAAGTEDQGIDIAVVRIDRWTEFDEDDTKQFDPDDYSFLGQTETLVRIRDNEWFTTAWISEAQFEEDGDPKPGPFASDLKFDAERKSFEWFHGPEHVMDLAGIGESTANVVEKLRALYDGLDTKKQAEMRGALRLVEDGYTSGYIEEESEILLRIYDMYAGNVRVNVFAPGPIVVEEGQCHRNLVGPIAEGETHEVAVLRMQRTFNKKVTKYAFRMHDEPIRGENQQFPVIIGTIWAEVE